ncbi:MAG: acetoin utilization protein AcuC [Chloroflexi bacterium]|nr:acetoin utilization protein AcuC [Chloroflexota bacterium]
MTSATPTTSFINSHEQSQHDLSPTHPMRPIRLMHMHELMRSVGLLDSQSIATESPRLATDDEIAIFHDADYLEVVKAIDAGAIVPGMHQFGFGPGDNPPRSGMFRHAALAAGGAMLAVERVLSGETQNAFVPAGGMHHHAMSDRASGFGIFNDAVIAIKHLINQGLRVFYVDIDVHHGDGVQAGLYDTDQAMTVSIHESGQWLFPGTGNPDETGTGNGEGYSVNIPLAPYTDDELWHQAFDAIIPDLARTFEPDLVFTQLGIDTHRNDPLAHLSLTTQGHNLAVQKFAALVNELDCPWIAVGGGGYDMTAVARAWTMDLATMANLDLADEIPSSFTSLPNMPTLHDQGDYRIDPDIRNDITRHNRSAIDEIKQRIFPRFGI